MRDMPKFERLTRFSLSVSRTDEQLERSVHLAFDQFGECTVKVRRDRHRHPFALVQYTVSEADQRGRLL